MDMKGLWGDLKGILAKEGVKLEIGEAVEKLFEKRRHQ